ncbi:Rft-1-domain-containing protein [Amylostereum chailletii]|nr:Rft-1-domain-containing protein [Amylostereum chailletii]
MEKMEPSSSGSPTLLSASLASASSLVLLQFVSRIFTFALNQALVRLASPQTFGTAAIQFELLLSTILFLSREGVRNALLRGSSSKAATSKQLVSNIALIPVALGIPAAFLIALVYVSTSSVSTRSQPYFHLSVVIYAIAASVELLSEPLYIHAQNELRFDIRVRAEGVSVFSKTVVTFVVLVAGPPEWALLSFAAGQAAYSLATLATFARIYGFGEQYSLRQVPVDGDESSSTALFDSELLRLSGAMTGQSVMKHFLTEGDKFLISHLSPLEDQGGYAIASNYGSLVARIVFQPIEETSRIFFSKSLRSPADSKEPKAKDAQRTAARLLLTILLLFTHLLLILATFAPPYLSLATSIFLPPRYRTTSAPQILDAYIYYIPTMAFNGVLEAFFASACTPADLRAQSRMMVAASVGFVLAAVGLTHGLGWGDVGLVWANIANLGLRALYAWRFARRFFKRRGLGKLVVLREVIPPVSVLSVFVAAVAITRWSAKLHESIPLTLWAQKRHIAVGGVCGVICILACFVVERTRFKETFAVLRRK